MKLSCARVLSLIVALLSFAYVAATAHAQGYHFAFKFGSHGSGNGEFNAPNGVAVSASGNIVVADSNNHCIQVFAPDS